MILSVSDVIRTSAVVAVEIRGSVASWFTEAEAKAAVDAVAAEVTADRVTNVSQLSLRGRKLSERGEVSLQSKWDTSINCIKVSEFSY